MGLFSDREDTLIITCPICTVHFDAPNRTVHWTSHVKPLPDSKPGVPSEFTWTCACGPSTMTWPDAESAAAGLALHMQLRHNIPLE